MRILRLFLVLTVSLLSVASVNGAQESNFGDLAGRIAYVDADFNVAVFIPQENNTVAITEDASQFRRYQWPTWSTDGRLAYFSTAANDAGFTTEVYVSPNGEDAAELLYSTDTEFFTYAYWSPQNNCEPEDTCRNLAVLLSSAEDNQFSVKLFPDGAASEATAETLVGRGSPFYYSWSPDGKRMLWQRNSRELDVYELATNSITQTIPQTPGYFQAPAWSPVNDRLLFGALNEDAQATDLTVIEQAESKVVAPALTGQTAFAWSPNGEYIAYINPNSPVIVIDAATGDVVTRGSVSGVIAFFWSPDSQQLAYLTLASTPDAISADADHSLKTASYVQAIPGIAWSVMNTETGATRRFDPFLPTNEMIYMLSFFDQFAQSHRLWSPDSRYLVYGSVIGASTFINLLDISDANSDATPIAEGGIGIWSYN